MFTQVTVGRSTLWAYNANGEKQAFLPQKGCNPMPHECWDFQRGLSSQFERTPFRRQFNSIPTCMLRAIPVLVAHGVADRLHCNMRIEKAILSQSSSILVLDVD